MGVASGWLITLAAVSRKLEGGCRPVSGPEATEALKGVGSMRESKRVPQVRREDGVGIVMSSVGCS